MTSESEIVDVIFTDLSSVFANDINATNVLHLITRVMEAVENYRNFDRAAIVRNVVDRFTDNITDEGVRNNVKMAVGVLLPSIVANICRVARGEYNVNSRTASPWASLCSSVHM